LFLSRAAQLTKIGGMAGALHVALRAAASSRLGPGAAVRATPLA